uniref:Uncharacterized protein n=1 Tax=Junco hyemalis TaxID=40217 RepID=A0A8C5JHM2_JUNHY
MALSISSFLIPKRRQSLLFPNFLIPKRWCSHLPNFLIPKRCFNVETLPAYAKRSQRMVITARTWGTLPGLPIPAWHSWHSSHCLPEELSVG